MRRALALLALPLFLAGCSLVKEPEVRELSGPTDGYTPTATYLKLHVKRDDGTVAMLDFDRRDWYTAGIAKMVDKKELRAVTAQALPRDVLNEYIVQEIARPDTLRGYHYDEMDATAEQRAQMDAEHEALLKAFFATLPETPAASSPSLPVDALP